MSRRLTLLASAGLTALGMLALGFAPADDEAPSAKTIMQKLNKGQNAEGPKLKKALNAAQPDWDAIQSSTKVYADLGPKLGKTDPPKGHKESWTKLTENFATESKALDDAAQKKDLATTKGAFQKLSGSCMACHKAHRGK